ncbi:MAG: FtsX-like permease family protein [Gammaproteobacteria bacterium]|nr:FtsX-like permease family protein [Gammaproteobacteria bacterium]NBT44599.1 FtsX-like permease family protein [Gammaproteobacteria bacterium]NBY23154.1 FtsX-like permease family protein [Gammaproteobacteria bacterium]NDE33775.1 FtsX-like permease family protein [Gammaproteobacteria bacterium]NDE55692.1 FtsX-like permease family protein [Gammaproteobacteria bacterium]
MSYIAIRMLMGDRSKYLGIIMGLTFASLIMTQQPAIFVGLMTRSFSFISDVGLPDIWVMDPKVQFVDDVKPLQDTELYRVRGVSGVDWAMPLYKGLIKARLTNGNFQTCNVIGLDDATLIGGPPEMLEGRLEDLRRADSVIVDRDGAKEKLGLKGPDGQAIPLKVGDLLELNDHRAIVVGIAKTTRTFQSQPVVYTTYSRAKNMAPRERKLLSFILVKAKPGVDPKDLTRTIESHTGLAAYTQKGFQDLTYNYYMKNTGIPINFGISVALGFLVGAAIAGQTFYSFTLENLRQFAVLKAMGAGNGTLLMMILLQAFIVGIIGYGLGVGLTSVFGWAMRNTILSFRFPWQLLLFSGVGVMLICLMAAGISIRKVMTLEPAMVFKT